MSAGPDIETIRAAHRRITPYIHRTPVLTSHSLNELAGAQLFFKCENLQKTGSFKIRGATNAVLSLGEDAARGVVTHSSGNHAAALAVAARARGVAAYIVMPKNSPEVKQRAVRAYGGEITLCEPTMEARDRTAREIQERTGAVLVHPYDDDRIIAGQATAAVELLDEVREIAYVLAPVSGGGLLSGTAIAVKSLAPGVQVIGCEPAHADDAYRSMAAGKRLAVDRSDTIADGLRAGLADRTFAILQERVDEIVLVSEEAIVEAMRNLWERMKIVVEASGAVPAAVMIAAGNEDFRKRVAGKNVGIILSGGNVDLGRLPFG